MKNLWKRIFSKSEDQNVTPDLEPQASEQSKATDLIEQSADRHLWATNAPEHWPAVIGSRQLNSMGFGNSLTADPFGLIGFAAMFVEACKSTQDSVSIENLDASAFGPEVSFLVNDRGLTVPVIIYPEATRRASVPTTVGKIEGFPCRGRGVLRSQPATGIEPQARASKPASEHGLHFFKSCLERVWDRPCNPGKHDCSRSWQNGIGRSTGH
jgi:hypothetical protein